MRIQSIRKTNQTNILHQYLSLIIFQTPLNTTPTNGINIFFYNSICLLQTKTIIEPISAGSVRHPVVI